MPATKITRDPLDAAKDRIADEHSDIVLEISRRLGVMVGRSDRAGIVCLAAALQFVCQQAFEQFQAKHGQTVDQTDQGSKPN